MVRVVCAEYIFRQNMAPLEGGWFDPTEESWTKNGTFGGDEWASEHVGHTGSLHDQSSWTSTGDGRKRFLRDTLLRSSPLVVQNGQMLNITGESSMQARQANSLVGGWSCQLVGDVMDVPVNIQSFDTKGHYLTSHIGGGVKSQGNEVDVIGERRRLESLAATLLTDEDSSAGRNLGRHKIEDEVLNNITPINDWDGQKNMTLYTNENVLRNQETSFSAGPSNFNSQGLRSTPLSFSIRNTDTCHTSARSVSCGGRQMECEGIVEPDPRREISVLNADGNRHMQGFSEAVSTPGSQDGLRLEASLHTALAQRSQVPGFTRRVETEPMLTSSMNLPEQNTVQSTRFSPETVMLTTTDTQNTRMQFLNGNRSNFAGRSTGTPSPTLTTSLCAMQSQPQELSSRLPTVSPSIMHLSSSSYSSGGGPNQLSQMPHIPQQQTQLLPHPSQQEEQMVGLQQSFFPVINYQNGTDCMPSSPSVQENMQNRIASGDSVQTKTVHVRPCRPEQVQAENWSQINHDLDQDLVYKQQQQSFLQGLSGGLTNTGEGLDRSAYPSDLVASVLVIQQLQATMSQLDVGTRLCIRDALYRLAKSAKIRRSCSPRTMNPQLPEPDSATINSCITGDGPCDGSRCRSETETNPLDRATAKLLFHKLPGYKVRSVTRPPSGAQHGQLAWLSTGTTCSWDSSCSKFSDSLEVTPKLQSGNPSIGNWATLPLANGFRAPNGAPIDSCMHHDRLMLGGSAVEGTGSCEIQPLDVQADKLSMLLPPPIQSSNLASANEVLNFDRSGDLSHCSMIPEGMRYEGNRIGLGKREVEPDMHQTYLSEASLLNMNYQSTLMPFREDVSHEIAATTSSVQEKCSVQHRFYHGEGNSTSNFSVESGTIQYPRPVRYTPVPGNTGGHMFGTDMDELPQYCSTHLTRKIWLS